MKQVKLISLPGARLEELAQRLAQLAPQWEVTVLDSDYFDDPTHLTQPGATPDPEDLVVEIQMTWEESLKAVGMDLAYNPEGLPWRSAYRQLARARQEKFSQYAQVHLSGQGSLEEVAQRLAQALEQARQVSS